MCRRSYRSWGYRSSKHGVILAIVGVFLLAKGLIFPAGILFVIAALRFGSFWSNPMRKTLAVIRGDAARNGLSLPDDPMVLSLLQDVYAKYWHAAERFPSLAPQYDEVMISMWQELKIAGNLSEWRRILRRVVDGWSAPWGEGQRPVEQSLGKLRHASTLWREAEAEVFGPSPRPT
jgi:hypothetical protein